MLYVLDTSALIDAWRTWYAIKVLPSFWRLLEEAGDDDVLIVPQPVLRELQFWPKDPLTLWVQERKNSLVVDLPKPVQRNLAYIADNYPNLTSSGGKSKNLADGPVIAAAMHYKGKVVAHETPSGNMNGPKLPDVCIAESIPCIKMYEMVKELGWQLGK